MKEFGRTRRQRREVVCVVSSYSTSTSLKSAGMSAPDSWEQLMDPRPPPGQGGDLGARFGRMNVNAQSFVPNVQAPSFVPQGSGFGPPYNYPMQHGEQQSDQGKQEGGKALL